MRRIKFLSVFVLLALAVSAGPSTAIGQEPLSQSDVGVVATSLGVAPHLHFEVRNSNNNDSPVVIRDMAGITWNPDNCTGSATY